MPKIIQTHKKILLFMDEDLSIWFSCWEVLKSPGRRSPDGTGNKDLKMNQNIRKEIQFTKFELFVAQGFIFNEKFRKVK